MRERGKRSIFVVSFRYPFVLSRLGTNDFASILSQERIYSSSLERMGCFGRGIKIFYCFSLTGIDRERRVVYNAFKSESLMVGSRDSL